MVIGKFGLNEADQSKLGSGDLEFLVAVLTRFAESWMEISGCPAQAWASVAHTDVAADRINAFNSTTPEQRAFLAAGCDLLGLLTLTPQGREAFNNLISDPLSQDAKRK